jgi:hypothetical protein
LTNVLDKQAKRIATSAKGRGMEMPVSLAMEILTASISEIPARALETRVPWSPKYSLA